VLESADQEIDLELGAAALGIRIQSGHDVTALDAELTGARSPILDERHRCSGTYMRILVTRDGSDGTYEPVFQGKWMDDRRKVA
jgi:hypothetical protein